MRTGDVFAPRVLHNDRDAYCALFMPPCILAAQTGPLCRLSSQTLIRSTSLSSLDGTALGRRSPCIPPGMRGCVRFAPDLTRR
jgi:hypothetical protein